MCGVADGASPFGGIYCLALTVAGVFAFRRLQRYRIQLFFQIDMILGHVPRQQACGQKTMDNAVSFFHTEN